jgi:hypothetical protein
MEKKIVKPLSPNSLKKNLTTLVNKFLKDNKVDLSSKNLKAVKKSIKRIAKKSNKSLKKAIK